MVRAATAGWAGIVVSFRSGLLGQRAQLEGTRADAAEAPIFFLGWSTELVRLEQKAG